MLNQNPVVRYFNQHFKAKLILTLSAIIIVCSLVTGYITYRMNLTLFENEISKQYLQTSEQTMEQIGFKIQDIYRITDFVFFHPYVEQIVQNMHAEAPDDKDGAYRNFLQERDLASILLPFKSETPYIRAVYIVDLQGNNLYFSQANASLYVEFPDFYKKVRKGIPDLTGEIVWQRMSIPDFFEPSGEKSSIVAARPLKSTKEQTVYGMIILVIDEAFFGRSLEPLTKGRAAGAYIYDQYDRLLYGLEQEKPAGFKPVPDRGSGAAVRHTDNNDYMYVQSVYDPRSFTLVSGISLAEMKAKGRNVYQLALLSGVISILLMAASVSIFSGKMLRPLHMLVKGMQRVREGNLKVELARTADDEFAFLARSFNDMVHNIQSLIQEVYASKLSEKEAELKALQAQLNPHFLHNALNTIYWKIIYLYDDEETAALVTSLSELLKYSLAPVSTPSTLAEELAQIRNYITIQEARYGEDLEVCLYAEETLAQCRMQRLLLQPLVENVFLHAFRDKTGEKRLAIRAFRREHSMIVEIVDNGCGVPEEKIARLLKDEPLLDKGREGIGVRNVIRRIKLVHGGAPYGLEMESLAEGTCMRVILPCEPGPHMEGAEADDPDSAGGG